MCMCVCVCVCVCVYKLTGVIGGQHPFHERLAIVRVPASLQRLVQGLSVQNHGVV